MGNGVWAERDTAKGRALETYIKEVLAGIGKLRGENLLADRKLCVTLRHTATFATKII